MPRPQQVEINSGSDTAGSQLERRVFKALLKHKLQFNLAKIVQCHGIHADGWVQPSVGNKIPIEIKTTLGWPQLTSASFQLVSIAHHQKMNATEGWIIYTQISNEWNERKFVKGLDHANACIKDFDVSLQIHFLFLDQRDVLNFTGGQVVT